MNIPSFPFVLSLSKGQAFYYQHIMDDPVYQTARQLLIPYGTNVVPRYYLEAEVARGELGDLCIHYSIAGDLSDIVFPSYVPYGSRQDGLWKHTCFEMFIRPLEQSGYAEFNFSPSTAWAGYWLRGYRASLEPLNVALNVIDMEPKINRLDLYVTLDASECAELPMDADWHVNLTAVIEEVDGTKSYWALKHPEGEPDFHDPDCFTLSLPAPGRA